MRRAEEQVTDGRGIRRCGLKNEWGGTHRANAACSFLFGKESRENVRPMRYDWEESEAMGMKRILETGRLMLREMTPDDFDALYAVLADADIMQHYPYAFDEARVRGWIERNMERYRKDGFGLWAVILKKTGEMIGDCGLTLQRIDGELLPEIGYHIRRDCQRRGYASEAGRAVRDWAFDHTAYDCLYSYMKYTNVPSYATAMAMGMKKIKQYPDAQNGVTFVFGMSREEWQRLKGRPETGAPDAR